MLRFQYDNGYNDLSMKIQIEDQSAEHISEWFSIFFQFMLAASWQPSTIEKHMREIIQEIDNNENLNIRDFAYI